MVSKKELETMKQAMIAYEYAHRKLNWEMIGQFEASGLTPICNEIIKREKERKSSRL